MGEINILYRIQFGKTDSDAKNWMKVYDFVLYIINQMCKYYSSADNMLALCMCVYIQRCFRYLRFLIFCTKNV